MRTSRTFSTTLESVHEARRFVDATLSGSVPRETLEIVSVLVSELATNVLLHAMTSFEIRVMTDEPPGRLRVEVVDTGPGTPAIRGPRGTEPRGRGLQIVAALSDEWGVEWASGPTMKIVWFEIDVSSRDDSTSRARA